MKGLADKTRKMGRRTGSFENGSPAVTAGAAGTGALTYTNTRLWEWQRWGVSRQGGLRVNVANSETLQQL